VLPFVCQQSTRDSPACSLLAEFYPYQELFNERTSKLVLVPHLLCVKMLDGFLKAAAFALISAALVKADLPIYTDGALASGWENWSWNSDINFAATDLYEGTSSMSVNSTAWAALSLKLEGTFPNYAGMRLDFAVSIAFTNE
jgi:hypothetical protein